MSDNILAVILSIVSITLLIMMRKGKTYDYKTRIRVYCAVYHDEIFFADTVRKNVVRYIKELGEGGEKPEIKIKYMSKLKYSLLQEL